MDTLFHGLLTYLIFRKKKYKFRAGFWGMVPDFFPAVSLIYFIYLGFLNNFGFFNIFLYREALPIYLFSHSLTPYLIISLGLLVFKKKEFWLPLAGGGLHILVDILTHSEGTVKTFYLFYPFFEKLSLTARYFSDENVMFVGGCWVALIAIYFYKFHKSF